MTDRSPEVARLRRQRNGAEEARSYLVEQGDTQERCEFARGVVKGLDMALKVLGSDDPKGGDRA